MLSVATSIDALAVGLSLAMLEVDIWYPGIMIGVITTGMSYLAIKIGTRLGALFGSRMEMIGGMVLIAIGLKIFFSHA
jgi:putative Mn2+ efflux pump MntP